MFKKKKEQILEKLKLIKESSFHLKESLYNNYQKGNHSSKNHKDKQKNLSVISRMRPPPKREGTNEKQTKEISKDILVKLQKKLKILMKFWKKKKKKKK